MINKIKWQISYFLILVVVLSLYLSITWFLKDSFKLSLLVTNAMALSLISFAGVMSFVRYYIKLPKLSFKLLILILLTTISSLLIDSYFVNFFMLVGRLAPLVSMFFAIIITATFIIAFNLVFDWEASHLLPINNLALIRKILFVDTKTS